jgi:hypothetical protein
MVTTRRSVTLGGLSLLAGSALSPLASAGWGELNLGEGLEEFWLAAIFARFGLSAPNNGSATMALFVAALSVAGAISLMLEMDQPYSGPIKISSAPLRTALEQLGRP